MNIQSVSSRPHADGKTGEVSTKPKQHCKKKQPKNKQNNKIKIK